MLFTAALFCLSATAALADDPRDFIYIYPDESANYNFVFDVSDGSVDTPEIHLIGMLSDYTEDELTAEEAARLTWSVPGTDAATLSAASGNDVVITVTGRDEDITVTATYDNPTTADISVPIFLVGEDEDDTASTVSSINVTVDGYTVPDVNLPNYTIPLFDVGTVTGDNDNDVLNYNPSVIHAALYALEVANDNDAYVWGDPNWDWDYVTPANVTLISEGAYLSAVYSDNSTNGYWMFTVNSADPGHAASAHQLHANDSIAWTYYHY
ncbi:DUF4430 domain-containing protein [Candidatus Formimonas warabiya]|uniref:DUF4430 domain-containing protein n=1 Tax=Formimonas warabiya TaxID=1761012 RepID=UPI001F3E9188|nr:DUF4430 domain-containing protein [Candidatus Formimonas warabiya]